jgi:hypothetical protein
MELSREEARHGSAEVLELRVLVFGTRGVVRPVPRGRLYQRQ